jgi:protein TonB
MRFRHSPALAAAAQVAVAVAAPALAQPDPVKSAPPQAAPPKAAAPSAIDRAAEAALQPGAHGPVPPPKAPPQPAAPIPPEHTDAMLAHYPPAARAAGIEGSATLACARIIRGAPDACKVASESPRGQGFGDAALALVKLNPQRPDGPSLDEKPPWTLTFAFKLKPPAITPDVIAGAHPQPKMLKHPNDNQMLEAYPYAAREASVIGFVLMVCTIAGDGAMSGCVAHANPSRYGFERAAIKLSPFFQAQTVTDDGAPTAGSSILIPILFALP